MLLAPLFLLLLASICNGEEGSGNLRENSANQVEGSGDTEEFSESALKNKLKELTEFANDPYNKLFSMSFNKLLAHQVTKAQASSDGTLVHDLRSFINVTFDWSTRAYDGNGSLTIPQCHEERLRKSYYKHQPSAWVTQQKEMPTGHLVYPLVLTVTNTSATEPRKSYYATGVHKLFAGQNETVSELVIVSEKTWTLVWDQWKLANNEGNELCDGGTQFDDIIPRINIEQEIQPQYDDIIKDYTDLTTDLCGAITCDCPRNQTETWTLGYPTEDGLEHIASSTPTLNQDLLTPSLGFLPVKDQIFFMRATSTLRMRDLFELCYENEERKALKRRLETDHPTFMRLKTFCLLLLATAISCDSGNSVNEPEESGQEDSIRKRNGIQGNSTKGGFLLPNAMRIFLGKQTVYAFSAKGRYEPTINGKLTHDMRTFVNVTFDWSSKAYDGNGSVSIPSCHEKGIRKSYYLHKIIDIGGITVSSGHSPLNQTWSAIMDLRPKTVLISFGTIAKSFQMPENYKKTIREVIRNFTDVTFIWKYEKPEHRISELIPNLIETTWVPQNDMLYDPRLSLFITHGGQGSITEATTAGIPMIVVPIFGDHLRNAAVIRRIGTGVVLEKEALGSYDNLENAIREVLENEKYREKARAIGEMIRHRPFTPRETFVRNMEFLARFGPLRMLDHYGKELNFVQFYLIDVIAFLGAVVILGFVILFKCLTFVLSLCCTVRKSKLD